VLLSSSPKGKKPKLILPCPMREGDPEHYRGVTKGGYLAGGELDGLGKLKYIVPSPVPRSFCIE
jgi:hypothetical protein